LRKATCRPCDVTEVLLKHCHILLHFGRNSFYFL
jgi:hypothetical protein